MGPVAEANNGPVVHPAAARRFVPHRREKKGTPAANRRCIHRRRCITCETYLPCSPCHLITVGLARSTQLAPHNSTRTSTGLARDDVLAVVQRVLTSPVASVRGTLLKRLSASSKHLPRALTPLLLRCLGSETHPKVLQRLLLVLSEAPVGDAEAAGLWEGASAVQQRTALPEVPTSGGCVVAVSWVHALLCMPCYACLVVHAALLCVCCVCL